MTKVKTSIYVDKELWNIFKKYALRRGIEVSKLIEELIKNEIIEYTLDAELLKLAGTEDFELDFEPIRPKEGLVSELVRVMRDERANNISRH